MKFDRNQRINAEDEFWNGCSHQERASPTKVLQKLFELLEDYRTVCYTHDNHDRAVAALKERA
jgi:hypothetical protein